MTVTDRVVRFAGQVLLAALVAEGLTRGLLATGWRPGPRVPDQRTGTTDVLTLPDGRRTHWVTDLLPTATQPFTDADDVFRVAIVGDSFAHGLGVSTTDRLGARLGQAMPTLDGDRVEVVHLANPGLDFGSELHLYRDLGEAYAPDHVVWVFLPNDLGVQAPGDDDLVNVANMPLPPSRSAVVSLTRYLLARRAAGRATEDAYRFALAPRPNDPLVEGMRHVQADLTARGARVTFVIFPLLHQLSDYPFAAEHAAIAARVGALGIDVVDLLPAFAGHDETTLWVSSEDHHPNAAGHALAAAAILPHLQRSPRAEGGPRPCPPTPAWPYSTPALEAARDRLCHSPDDGAAWRAWGEALSDAPPQREPLDNRAMDQLGRLLEAHLSPPTTAPDAATIPP